MGSFLYYGRAVDPTILPAINEIGITQAAPTKNTEIKAKQLLDYLSTHPSAKLRFKASDMCLHVDTDAAYLVAPKARSRVAGYYYLSDHPSKLTNSKPTLNAGVHVECKLLRHVVSSAAEAETAGIFTNCQLAIPIRRMLHILGHPQPPTPIKTDNKTATSFANNTLKNKKSKSWDMRYYWIKDKVSNQDFVIYWDRGLNNYADYFTKHFPASYHQKNRPTYILKGYSLSINSPSSCVRGCVETHPGLNSYTGHGRQTGPLNNNIYAHTYAHAHTDAPYSVVELEPQNMPRVHKNILHVGSSM